MINLMTFTTLYPNVAQPEHGIFVENRLRFLLASQKVKSRVVAPVAYFPFTGKVFGRFGTFASVPRQERRHGIVVDHPRFLSLPGFGTSLSPRLLYLSVRHHVRNLLRSNPEIRLIDAHYFYPDGVAACYLAREFGLPFVITARGADVNHFTTMAKPRRLITEAATQAAKVITVSQALKDRLVDVGVAEDSIVELRNGVDLETFHPTSLGLRGRSGSPSQLRIATIARLVPSKGNDLVIEALAHLPEVHLTIVGIGPELTRLQALASDRRVAERVSFRPRIPHQEMADFYNSVDLTVLASRQDGFANVLIESLACGTPVVATAVGGAVEIIDPSIGALVAEREPQAMADAISRQLTSLPDRSTVRSYAEDFSWDKTTAGQIALFEEIIQQTPVRSR